MVRILLECFLVGIFELLKYGLLHLVANVISEFEMCEEILSPLRGECYSGQCPWWSGSYDAQQDTGRERLIRSHLLARFCFELSGNLN